MKTVQYIPLAKAIADAIAMTEEGHKILAHFLTERTKHDLNVWPVTINSASDWRRSLANFYIHHAYQWSLIDPVHNILCHGYDEVINKIIHKALYTGNVPTSYAAKLKFITAIRRNFKAALNIDANVWQDCFRVVDFWRGCSDAKFMDTPVAKTVFDLLDLPKYLDLPDSRNTFNKLFLNNLRSLDPNEIVNDYNFKVTEASIIGVLKDQYGVDASYKEAHEVDLTYVDSKYNIVVQSETREYDDGRVRGVKIVNNVLAYDDSFKPVLFLGGKWRGPEDLEHLKEFQPFMHNDFFAARPIPAGIYGATVANAKFENGKLKVDFDNVEPKLCGMAYSNGGFTGRFKSDEPNESNKPSADTYEAGNNTDGCKLDFVQVMGRGRRRYEVKIDQNGIISGLGEPIKPITVIAPELYEAIKNEIRRQLSELTAPSHSESVERSAVHIGGADIHSKRVSDKVDAAPVDDRSSENMGERHSVSYQAVQSFNTSNGTMGADSGDSNSDSSDDATTKVLDTFETRYNSTTIHVLDIDKRLPCDDRHICDITVRNFEQQLNTLGIAVAWSNRIPLSTYGNNREVVTIARKDGKSLRFYTNSYPVYAGHDILIEFDIDGCLTNADFSVLCPKSD